MEKQNQNENIKKKIPVIIGDIGGTNSRLSLITMSLIFADTIEVIKTEILNSQDFPSVTNILEKFLEQFKNTEFYPDIGVIGIPGPIFNNSITIIANLDWPMTKGEDVAKILGLKKLIFLNDFVVNGYGILSNIKEGIDYEKLNNNKVDPHGPIAMIGAGTGLGHGYIVKSDGNKYHQVFPSEGGHQDFAPTTKLQFRYNEYLEKYYDITHVSIERACSGPAISIMYQFFMEIEKFEPTIKSGTYPPNSDFIIQNGLSKKCILCEKIIEFFVEIYAAAAGNMSLLLMPTGGLYLLGGLSVVLEEYMIKEDVFRNSFKNKGRLQPLLETIPLFVVKNSLIGVKGAEEYARRVLEGLIEEINLK